MADNRRAKLIGGVRIGPNQKIWYRTDPGDPFTGITIDSAGPRVWYPTNNAESFDLIKKLNDRFVAESADCVFSVLHPSDPQSDSGFVRVESGESYFELSCRKDTVGNPEDNCDNLWALLFPDQVSSAAQEYRFSWPGNKRTHHRPHGFALYPRRYFVQDVTERRYRQSQELSLGGRGNKSYVSRLLARHINVRLTGAMPRELVWSEYQSLCDLLAGAAQGKTVLVYGDMTNNSPYAQLTNPYGYWAGVLKQESFDFEPAMPDGDRYDIWEKELIFQEDPATIGTV